MSDLYVSYSPADSAFVTQLARELTRHELDAGVEGSSDDSAEASCPPHVERAIAESEAMVFVIRPESLRSPRRNAELELAFSHNKRVIPIVREDPAGAPIPDRLAATKWIHAGPEEAVRKVVDSLVHTLRSDLRAARAHRASSIRMHRRHYRETYRPRWDQARQPVLATVALVALVLGTIGFLQAPQQHFNFFDAIYRSLGLFLLGGAVAYKVPLALQIARILAPFALGWSALHGILSLFDEELQVLRIRLFARNHVVVVGLGSAGAHAVKAFYHEGWTVVAIERDPANPRIAAARELGIPVLSGDARDAFPLRRARIERARNLLITSGDDGANFDIATKAADLVAERTRGVLTVFVHIRDLRLWRGLKARGMAAVNGPAVRLEVFNVYFTAAHLMVDKFPPFEDGEGNALDDPHVCVIGLEGIGEGLVRRIASTWRQLHPDRKLRLTIAGPSADVDLQSLLLRIPVLEDICDLDARPMDISSAEFACGGALLDSSGNCDVTRAYVALHSQGESLAAAFGLHGGPQTDHVPVIVTLDDGNSGTARALDGVKGMNFARGVEPFGVLTAALTPAIALQGMTELIARQRHAEWMRERLAEGKPSDATVPWEKLREEYKEANRRFADSIGEGLREAGCALAPAPLSGASEDDFSFTDDEIELLAEREHQRWMEEQLRDGWRPGAEKNLAKHTHPHLVPWAELPPDVRQDDRDTMRDLPRFLAGVGLAIYRLATAPGGHAPAAAVAPPTQAQATAPAVA